ncbi:MAG: EAL domain-containing protein [Candidatus Nitrotoga sp.]
MIDPNVKPKILVVEDEFIVARDIQQQLVSLGYNAVGHAIAGEQAIVLAQELKPDLVLMDIQLAGTMDGIEAAKILRTQHSLPVIFLTAFATDDVLARAKLAEPYGYIIKPFTEQDLHTMLEMALYKKQMDIKLSKISLRNHTILENMVDGIITIDERGTIDFFNKAACTIFGYQPEEVHGRNVSMLMPEPHRSHHDGYLEHYKSTGEARMLGTPREVTGQRKDGSEFFMSLSVSALPGMDKTAFIGTVRDITERLKSEVHIRRLTYYDPLTNLPNRNLLLDRLKCAINNSARTSLWGVVMLLDLDHFKQLNDLWGHSIGDEVLCFVATRLLGCIREIDSVARMAGDEFIVLIEASSIDQHSAAAQAKLIGNKILVALRDPYIIHGEPYFVTPSIGIAMFMQSKESIDEIIKNANVAMYQAKARGRNTIEFYDPILQAAAVAHAALIHDMSQALTKNEFVVHYQIQVNSSGVPIGVEALVRWCHPLRGMISPADFIPLAEETGMIISLGLWVMETACNQLHAWASQPETAQWTMAVNVSASQFEQAEFADLVSATLQKSGANPNLLKLELTESMLSTNVDSIILKMMEIGALGTQFSLDDFGTGYSSLSYLKRMPLNQLKIDKSFVKDVLTDPYGAAIASSIVALGHNMGMNVIAEGVETVDQLEFLTGIGCDGFQGYYFGRPVPACELAKWASGQTEV